LKSAPQIIIEEMSPFAMDQVNADAYQEAYKDLLNLMPWLRAGVSR